MQKILIIRFSSIGDIVLTTPVIRCLKEQLKDVEIHYLTKTLFASILSANPHIDKLYSIEKDVAECVADLKKENYDHIVDLHNNLRSAVVKRSLKRPATSLNKINVQKWLKVNFGVDKMPDVHIVERYLETVKKLEVHDDGKGLDYFIADSDHVSKTELPAAHQNGYVGVVIGARHATKMMPSEKLISICKKISKPIVLLGGKEDTKVGDEIQKAVGDSVFNSCGKFNINQSASLVKQAEKIITHDTGLMHIAAAFQKEITSLWGNTIPEFGMYPYRTSHGENGRGNIMEIDNLSCRPCSKIGYSKCPKGHFKCMLEIDENAVANSVS